MSSDESNGNEKDSKKKSSENNSETESLNQAKILTPKKKTRDEKIDELITLGNSAIEVMMKATKAMEKSIELQEKSIENQKKSIENQDILIKYIYEAMKRQEKEEEEKKKKKKNRIKNKIF